MSSFRALSVPLPNCSSLIKCPICHDILKNPKILSCFHHFCAECIGEHHRQTQSGNEARCPICRRPFVLDFAGASDLPTCPYAQAMLDEIEKVKREKKEKSQTLRYCNALCQDENVTRLAIFSCSTCPCDLCESCMKAHTKFLRTHILISLDENETDKSDPILKIITDITTSTCSLHSQNEVDQLCKACNIPFCKECERSHSGHEVITLQTIKSETKAMREGILKRKDVLEKFKGDLNGFMIMLQTGEEKALREISDYYNGWMQKLTEHREEISDDLRKKSTRIQNDVITHLKFLDDQSVFAERFLYNLNRLYAAGNNKSTLSTWNLIIENYEKLRENEKYDIYLPEKFAFRFVKPRQDFKIFGKIIEAKAYYDLYGMFRDKEQTMEEIEKIASNEYVREEPENTTNDSGMSIAGRGNALDYVYEYLENGKKVKDTIGEKEHEDEYEYQERGKRVQEAIGESEHEDYREVHKDKAIYNNFLIDDLTGNEYVPEEPDNTANDPGMSIAGRGNALDYAYAYEYQRGQKVQDTIHERENEDEYEYQERGQKVQETKGKSEHEDYTVVHKEETNVNNCLSDDSTDSFTCFDDDEEYTDTATQQEQFEGPLNNFNDKMMQNPYLNEPEETSEEKNALSKDSGADEFGRDESEMPPLPPRTYKRYSDEEETAVKGIESQDDLTPLTHTNNLEGKGPFVCLRKISLAFEVSGGTMLPDGNILLTSFNAGELMICKESGEILKREKAKYVWDAAAEIDESGFPHVYVTFVKPSARKKPRIDVFTTEGNYHGLFSKDVNHPLGIACSSTEVFVSDQKSIIKVFIVASGSLKYVIRNPLFKKPWSIALKNATEILVSDFGAHCVFLINLKAPSVIRKTYDKTTDSDTSEFLPGKSLYRRKICFLSDQLGGKVRVITDSGRVRTFIRDIFPGIKFVPLLLLMNSKDNLVIVSTSGQIAIMELDFGALSDYTNEPMNL